MHYCQVNHIFSIKCAKWDTPFCCWWYPSASKNTSQATWYLINDFLSALHDSVRILRSSFDNNKLSIVYVRRCWIEQIHVLCCCSNIFCWLALTGQIVMAESLKQKSLMILKSQDPINLKCQVLLSIHKKQWLIFKGDWHWISNQNDPN